jgi:hypothetical protein
MATQAKIIQQIERAVDGDYQDWKIGLTDDSALRKAQMGDPQSWVQWQANSVEEAIEIIQFFRVKGMTTTGLDNRTGEFIYILLVRKPEYKSISYI